MSSSREGFNPNPPCVRPCMNVHEDIYGAYILLRSESPSSMCAKLRTVAASNNRDHEPQSLLLLLVHATYIYCCSSRTSRSWWITRLTQRHPRGCTIIPSFLQRSASIAHSFVKAAPGTAFHILVTAPFCCDRKAQAACAQSFALWQQATIEIMRHNLS